MSDPKPICFVLSPIGEDGTPERAIADKVLKHLVVKALGETFEVVRADDDSNPGAITPRIVSSIIDATLVVADLSGYNPNVFYELAIAHGYRRPVVHIQRAGERPAFDVKDMRTVRYDLADPDSLEAAQDQLMKLAKHAVERPETVSTPLTASVKFAELEASSDPVAESSVQIIEAISDLRYEVRRALRTRSKASVANPSGPAAEDAIRLRKIVRRVVDDGRAQPSDFAETISIGTTGSHDAWVREGLRRVTGIVDAKALNEVLYDSDALLILAEDSDSSAADGPDEPPF